MTHEELRKQIEEKIENVWIGFGEIHSQGKEITYKDLDDIRDKTVSSILSLLRKALPEEKENNQKSLGINEAGTLQGGYYSLGYNKALSDITRLLGGGE